ncbi:MAG: hypothetical protein WD825_02025 [Gemmatimonadaceae bacterium]
MFAALGARVTEPLRDPKYDSARVRIANAAFIPSRVWDDTSVWTSATSSRRTLLIGGRFVNGRYQLDAARLVPAPEQPAESRHVITLTRLSDDEFAWDTEVPYAIGSITAREVGAFTSALFAGAEGRSERDVRADYRATIPRTSAVLGQLFRVDSIKTTHLPDSSTIAAFAVTMTPAGVETKYPNFARYMRRYAQTARMRLSLTDRTGASYLDLMVAEGRLMLRVRTLKGDMVPLTGPARPMPDSLTLNGDFTMKVRRLTVGFHDYHADFVVVRNDRERAWSIVSKLEPKWTLPFVTERLLRTPLRRPFRGRGALFRIGVRDSAGAQTILDRRLHLEVQESMILRFIGRLGAIAVSDYQGLAEREQLAWLREAFDALVADLRGLSP